MQRTKENRKASAILTSDWHLRETTPVCFTGDFQKEQWDSVGFISMLQKKHNCPVFHAGDLFDHWKPSPWLLTQASVLLPDSFITVYGQHDLPQHSLALTEKCGVFNLCINGKVSILEQGHWGWEPKGGKGIIMNNKEILIWHHLTYQTKPFPEVTGGMAAGILRKYPQYDLIVTGDNHQSFVEEYKGRLLVNPGPITRQTADQIDFKPRVYLWYEEDNSVKPVYLPIQEGVITREHIEIKEARDKRIDAFISQLDGDWNAEMSFEENLKAFQAKNNIKDSIMEIVYKAIE